MQCAHHALASKRLQLLLTTTVRTASIAVLPQRSVELSDAEPMLGLQLPNNGAKAESCTEDSIQVRSRVAFTERKGKSVAFTTLERKGKRVAYSYSIGAAFSPKRESE